MLILFKEIISMLCEPLLQEIEIEAYINYLEDVINFLS